MPVFKRAYEILEKAARQRDMPVPPNSDTEWTMAFKLYDEACEAVRTDINSTRDKKDKISSGDVMGPNYENSVRAALERTEKLAFQGWTVDGADQNIMVKTFPSSAGATNALDTLTYVQLGNGQQLSSMHKEGKAIRIPKANYDAMMAAEYAGQDKGQHL